MAFSALDSTVRLRPTPSQWRQTVVEASSSERRRRWRLISMRPNWLILPHCTRARSEASASFMRFSTARLFLLSSMSMKSITISPARSRSRIWRATSSAASRLVFSAVRSTLRSLVERPEFTSTLTSASVGWITR